MTDRKQALTELLGAVEAGLEISDGYNHHLLYVCFPAIQLAGTDNPRFNESVNSAVNAYNGSLDAAKALFEAVLPGWRGEAITHRQGMGEANVTSDPTGCDVPSFQGRCMSNPARAWLIAVLKAVIAQEDVQ